MKCSMTFLMMMSLAVTAITLPFAQCELQWRYDLDEPCVIPTGSDCTDGTSTCSKYKWQQFVCSAGWSTCSNTAGSETTVVWVDVYQCDPNMSGGCVCGTYFLNNHTYFGLVDSCVP